jgi:hypothetical protein
VKAASLLWSTCRWCGSSLCSFAWWTLWLLLGALLALQIYVLGAHQLTVPAFLLRALESRLAASQLTVHFRRAIFDPSGRMLAEDVRLESRDYAEPLFTARAVFIRLDPWALLVGHFDPREIRVVQASLFVPAMLSPTGRTEAFVSDCNGTAHFVPSLRAIELAQFNGRIGNLVVAAHGGLRLPESANTAATGVLPLAEFFSKNYPRFSRQFTAIEHELASLDEPLLQLELTPSDTRGALVTATLDARAVHREDPWPLRAADLRATASCPLLGEDAAPASLDLRAAELSGPANTHAGTVRLQVRGVVWPGLWRAIPRSVDLSAATFGASSIEGTTLLARLIPAPLPRLQAEIAGRVAGEPVSLHALADLESGKARVAFNTGLGPALLAQISARLHSHWPDLIALTSPIALHGRARFDDGWRLGDLSVRFEASQLAVQDVALDAVRGEADFHGHELAVTDIVLRQHDNLALGLYTMDTATRDYRFLLHGRLRPLDVAGWFTPSWSRFWKNFVFPSVPPDADVDVLGRWGQPKRTDVFVFADVASPVVRGVAFDRLRALLRYQPDLYDGREVLLVRGARTARGKFTRSVDLSKDSWRHMDFDVTSNLDLADSARLFGKSGEDFVAPFKFAQPPTLHATGTLDSPAAPGGEHQWVQLVVASAGQFTLYDFPLNDVSFDATLRDNDIDLPRISASFSDGLLNGRAFLSGPDNTRRLRFDFHLAGASLGRTVTTVDEFLAQQRKQPPDPPTKFIQRANDIRLDLAAFADGSYHDPLSFIGSGSVALAGAELEQIHLLGLLSQLLSFTSLRFTAAQATFMVDRDKISFPQVKVTGANSAILAKGDYRLDKKTLDFNAKVYPFGQSKFTPSKLAGLVLTPVSDLAEVTLTGTLDQPRWAFTYGPTNFLRKITQDKPSPTAEKSATEPPRE